TRVAAAEMDTYQDIPECTVVYFPQLGYLLAIPRPAHEQTNTDPSTTTTNTQTRTAGYATGTEHLTRNSDARKHDRSATLRRSSRVYTNRTPHHTSASQSNIRPSVNERYDYTTTEDSIVEPI
ncbi:hypothetical protein SARC_14358, partial [Sphaeroforma arctica JP610]